MYWSLADRFTHLFTFSHTNISNFFAAAHTSSAFCDLDRLVSNRSIFLAVAGDISLTSSANALIESFITLFLCVSVQVLTCFKLFQSQVAKSSILFFT